MWTNTYGNAAYDFARSPAVCIPYHQTPPLPPPPPPPLAPLPPASDCPNLLDPEKGTFSFTDELNTGSVASLSCSPYPPECVHCVTHSCDDGQIEVVADESTATDIIPIGCPMCRCIDATNAPPPPVYLQPTVQSLVCVTVDSYGTRWVAPDSHCTTTEGCPQGLEEGAPERQWAPPPTRGLGPSAESQANYEIPEQNYNKKQNPKPRLDL